MWLLIASQGAGHKTDLVERHTVRVDIALDRPCHRLHHALGAKVPQGTNSLDASARCCVEKLGETEIAQLSAIVISNEYIGALHVPMDDSLLMQIRQPGRYALNLNEAELKTSGVHRSHQKEQQKCSHQLNPIGVGTLPEVIDHSAVVREWGNHVNVSAAEVEPNEL